MKVFGFSTILTLTVSVVLLILGMPATAQADLVTFTADIPGSKPNGYMSPESGLVSFSDSVGADLSVLDGGTQTIGQGLVVFTDFDDSHLIMTFGALVDTLALDFGNDDPGFSDPGDLAVLRAFLGGVQVGEVTVVMNRNDIMDQTIAISGVGPFDTATFKYNVVPTKGLIEAVDNILFTAVVPEATSLLLFSTATIAWGSRSWLRRRRLLQLRQSLQ